MDFNRYISAAEFAPLAELFRREGESLFVPKDGCFSFQQVRNRRSGLVEEGAFRYVHATEAGERHVVGYAFAGEFVGDYISMRNDAPAWVSIEAMCDSRVLTLTGERLEKFYRTDAAHERLRTAAAIVRLDSAGALRIAAGALSRPARTGPAPGAGLVSRRASRNAEPHSPPGAVIS